MKGGDALLWYAAVCGGACRVNTTAHLDFPRPVSAVTRESAPGTATSYFRLSFEEFHCLSDRQSDHTGPPTSRDMRDTESPTPRDTPIRAPLLRGSN